MRRYINRRDKYYRETVDELTQADFPNYRAFVAELRRLLGEYRLADPAGEYRVSSRPCRGWQS